MASEDHTDNFLSSHYLSHVHNSVRGVKSPEIKSISPVSRFHKVPTDHESNT